MKNAASRLRRAAYDSLLCAFAVSLCCLGTACHQETPNPPPAEIQTKTETPNPPLEAPTTAGMQQRVTSFRQILTSSKTNLKLHPGEDTKIPVRIQNPGTETWISAGQYPVNISYKWYKKGQMMRIEGERTALPSPIGPNQAVDAQVRVVAPLDAGNYALRLSLVQEAVAWFMIASNTFLELPATVQ
jgi:hypothetical protein